MVMTPGPFFRLPSVTIMGVCRMAGCESGPSNKKSTVDTRANGITMVVAGEDEYYWLVVSSPLKKYCNSQNGNLPQIVVNIRNV